MKGNFQIAFLVIFMAAAVVGLLVFSGAIPIGDGDKDTEAHGTVVLWGTVDSRIVRSWLEDFSLVNNTFVVKYVEKSESAYEDDLLKAFAAGTGPDLFFVSDGLTFKYSDQIFTIPYKNFSLNTFKKSFIGAGGVFLTSKGISAFPIAVDPLMMYYNRNMLDTSGIVYPPLYWEELVNLVPLLTKKNESGMIVKSAVAMGQFTNILHAKDILSALFMQSGSPIVIEEDESFTSVLAERGIDLGSILKFYTDFADPSQDVYSWNRSFPDSRDAFRKENLAFYFGFASELSSLIARNPNQNLEVAPVPQVRESGFKLTSSHVLGIAVSSFSKNFNTALIASGLIANSDLVSKLVIPLGMVPARRDLIKIVPSDAYAPAFYASALYAASWLDPSPKATNEIFQEMVEKVISNSASAKDAVANANAKLGFLLFR